MLVTPSQSGKTEFLFNLIGKRFHLGPRLPMLYIGPTQDQVQAVSRSRITPMVNATPALAELLHKGQEDKLLEKFFAGVRLGFAWAGSSTQLASHPVGCVLLDEIDRENFQANTGGEGDAVTLARARTKAFIGRKVVLCSTPTIEGLSPIMQYWADGSKRRWCWRCPSSECAQWFVPTLATLRWPEKASAEEAREHARVECPACGQAIEDRDRPELAAEYRPFCYDDADRLVECEEPETPPRIESYWVTGAANLFLSLGELAETMVRAYRAGDSGRIQATVNTYFGEPWATRGDAPDWQQVLDCRGPYNRGELHEQVQRLTCGVDVQRDGLYWSIRGWGYALQSFCVQYGFLVGDPAFDDVWIALANLLARPWGGLSIERMMVDSGFNPLKKYARPDNQVYRFCRTHMRAYAAKGRRTMETNTRKSLGDVTPHGKRLKTGVEIWLVNTDYFKTSLYDEMRRTAEGTDPRWWLPADVDENYCKQVTAEEAITTVSGARAWRPVRKDNHYLDCEVLAWAGADIEQYHAILKPKAQARPPIKRVPKRDPTFTRRGI